MTRLILTFENLFQVLEAERHLRSRVSCRPTPTPLGLSDSICGMSLELLDQMQKDVAVEILEKASLFPTGIHEIN